MLQKNSTYIAIPLASLLIFWFLGYFGAISCRNRIAQQPYESPASVTPAVDITYVAFDTETTGFSPVKNRIMEIGAVKFRGTEILAETNWLINPKQFIPWYVTKVHGIKYTMVTNSPVFKEVYPEFLEFIGDCVLIAHNANFDVGFMHEEIKRNDFKLPGNPIIDSLPLFRAWFPQAKAHTLEALTKELGIDGKEFHRATEDSLYIIKIMNKKKKWRRRRYPFRRMVEEAGGLLNF